MQTIKYDPRVSIDDILTKHGAEVIDFCEGCLLDNFFISSGAGGLAVLESYLNPQTSYYTAYINRDGATFGAAWDIFSARRDACEGV